MHRSVSDEQLAVGKLVQNGVRAHRAISANTKARVERELSEQQSPFKRFDAFRRFNANDHPFHQRPTFHHDMSPAK
jgi:hypothetical protein